MTGSTPLRELAAVIRSKNAGPFEITYDVLFTDPAVFTRIRASGVLTRERMVELYQLDEADVVYCAFFEPALAFKLTHVRRAAQGKQGGVGERDTFGAQQHAPLLDLLVQDGPA